MGEVAALEVVATPATSTAALVFFAFERVGIAELVVLTSLLRIREYSHRLIDSLESFVSLWRVVLIWVHLQALLLVRSLQILIVDVPGDAEH